MDTSNTANVTCTARNAQGNIIPNAINRAGFEPVGALGQLSVPRAGWPTRNSGVQFEHQDWAMGVRALGTNAISSLPVVLSGVSIPVTGPGVPAQYSDHLRQSATALVDQAFSAPLVIKVTDSQGNPVSGTPDNLDRLSGFGHGVQFLHVDKRRRPSFERMSRREALRERW